ncbi:thioredoxin-disulfide reductase [Boothiomyces macroporosus]|uniref:Thioredoxin reductase n=1 Tax=Boothiomyces macroporosus TaxID=261099 RepID=A0AAD5UH80_9FUNG|nr:thioredoxin-disulfide reductase [Boothiomyces macroporosus]KAJ3257649.1 thioredoxin-disulfide reductase [Boothiomyces macroporosus]
MKSVFRVFKRFNSTNHNVVIIGSGPAAHTAAIYCARANLNPVMYEGYMAGGVAAGGQLTTTTEVENFPGFPKGISGPELMENMRNQSERFGTVIVSDTISKLDLTQRPFKLWIENEEDKEPILAKSLIVATGATAKRLNIAGEDKYWQAGISACAGKQLFDLVCDGAAPIFKNKELAVVGGGDSACEEAMFLTKYASKVYLLVRRDQLRASKVMQDRLKRNPKIEILWNTIPIKANGDRLLTNIELQDTKTKETRILNVNGLFYAIGHLPNTSIFSSTDLKLDSDGYIITNGTETNIEGVFACGDVQDKRYRQAITAAG